MDSETDGVGIYEILNRIEKQEGQIRPGLRILEV